jgi:hypothetical protein
VAIYGSGFTPDATITFSSATAAGAGFPLSVLGDPLVISNALGTFAAMVTVARGTPGGPLTIAASDGTYTARTTLQIEDPAALTPPAVPITPTTAISTTLTPTLPLSSTAATAAYFAEGYTEQANTPGHAGFTETLSLFNPGSTPALATIQYVIAGRTTPLVVTRTVPAQAVLRESVNGDVGPNQQVAAIVTSPETIYVTRSIERIDGSGAHLGGSTASAAAPSTTWLFPEGYTGASFQEYLTLLNPSPTPATVQVTLAPQATSGGARPSTTITLAPLSRSTVNVRALAAGRSTKSVGLLVTSSTPIVAERVEYFGAGVGSDKAGTTVSNGSTVAALTLDEPATVLGAGDQHYLTLLNPATTGNPVSVQVQYAGPDGQILGHTTVQVAPAARQTIASAGMLGSAQVTFSVVLTATGPIAAEAAQYTGGSPNTGMHPGFDTPAVPGAQALQYLPNLSTQLADQTAVNRTLTLFNPGTADTTVAVSYFGVTGTPVQTSYTVPAGGIVTASVNQAAGSALPAGPLAAVLRVLDGNAGVVASSVGVTAGGHSVLQTTGMAP